MRKIIGRYKYLPIELKATIWFTICNFALKGISFICMPLYTRLLPADEYGRMNVLTSYEQIFNIFATFEIYLGAFQRGILKFNSDVKTFEQSIVFFSNILTVTMFWIFILFQNSITSFTGISLSLYAIMTLYFLGFTPYNCWLNKKRFYYEYKSPVLITVGMSLLANLFPMLFLLVWKRTAYVKVAGTLIISTIFCIPFWLDDFNPVSLIKNKKRTKEYLSFALKFQSPLVFHSLSYYILNQSDRIMIDKFSDPTKVAFYSVAYSLATVIILVQNSINQVLKPWRYKKLEVKQYSDVSKLSDFVLTLVGGAIIVFMLIVPEVFRFLFTEQYYESLVCIPPISMSVYFLFLYTIFVDIESYYGNTKYIAYVSTVCAILNIVLNYIGMKIFNYVICAYTTLVSYAVMSFFHYLFMVKTCKRVGIQNVPVNAKFIWKFSAVMMGAFIVINSVYQIALLRYIILIIIGVFAILKRKQVMEMVLRI